MLDEAGMQLQGIVFCEELTKQEQQAHYESLKEKVQTEFYTEAELQKLTADILLTTTPKNVYCHNIASHLDVLAEVGLKIFY